MKQQYRVVSACAGRRAPGRGGVAGRRGAAGRDDPGRRAGCGRCRRRWRRGASPAAVHDPGKIAAGSRGRGRDRAGTAWPMSRVLRAEPGVFGPVASDPTVSRLIDALAADADRRVGGDRHGARRGAGPGVAAWPATMPRTTASTRDSPLIVDLDATLVTAHSEKEQAAPTFKRGFGFHPLCAFVDHGAARHRGAGRDPAAARERRLEHRRRPHHGHQGTRCAQLPGSPARAAGRAGRCWSAPTAPAAPTTSSTGCTAQRLSYSVGFTLPDDHRRPAANDPRAGVDPGLRRRRPGPRRRLGRRAHRPARPDRLAGRDAGHRPQGTPAPRRPAAVHRRRRAPASPRSPPTPPAGSSPTWSCGTAAAPAPRTGSASRKTPACATCRCTTSTQNQIWCAIVALAAELTAWMQMLALHDHAARRWEPKRLRLRIFSLAGASPAPAGP